MKVHISIGQNHRFALREALLVYGDSQKSFITRHEITAGENAPPTLGPAQPLTVGFVEALVRALHGNVTAEVLPENVLAKGDRTIVWWTPPQRRQMFYKNSEGKCAALNGRTFPQPALVWRVANGELSIRALGENKRPDAKTKLAFAPFWNLSTDGRVCTGTMRCPDNASAAGIADWERGFYESEFTHSNVGRLTRHPGGFEALWQGLADKRKAFPRESLIPLPETLAQFVAGGGRSMQVTHTISPDLLSRRALKVLVVGCGGTGSAIAMGLPYLDQAMRVWGHTHGLDVTMMDADVVSPTNCIRQPFSASDIGLNKATVLINRLNLFWGTAWSAVPTHFHSRSMDGNSEQRPDLLIGCVDTRAARKAIATALERSSSGATYWLDIGNNASSGQFVLGQPLNGRNRRKAERLRTVSELYPEIADASSGEDPLPSCSAIEALERQEPFVNQVLATSALAMLARLFRHGTITHHGGFYNATTGRMSALAVDPLLWRRTRQRCRKGSSPARAKKV